VTVSTQTGKASYYFGRWIGRKTASGEIYRASDVTAAHRTLPFNTMVRVTNLRNDLSVIVRINNRGPFVRGRIIDLSLEAARAIDMTRAGVVPVKVEVLRKVEVMPAPNLRRREGPLTPPESAGASPARETGGAAPSSRVSGGRRR
jgi:rare lipoprotein A